MQGFVASRYSQSSAVDVMACLAQSTLIVSKILIPVKSSQQMKDPKPKRPTKTKQGQATRYSMLCYSPPQPDLIWRKHSFGKQRVIVLVLAIL